MSVVEDFIALGWMLKDFLELLRCSLNFGFETSVITQ